MFFVKPFKTINRSVVGCYTQNNARSAVDTYLQEHPEKSESKEKMDR